MLDGCCIVILNVIVYISVVIVNIVYLCCCCEFLVGIGYEDDIKKVKDIILGILD